MRHRSLILIVLIISCACTQAQTKEFIDMNKDTNNKVMKTEEEWKRILTPEQYHVVRKGGTEPAFTGVYDNFYQPGIYECIGCGNDLFSGTKKFKSGSGWPSFWDVIDKGNIKLVDDHSFGMHRTEVRCGVCDAHLGHVFNDGPEPTNLRYCINSAALNFVEVK